MSESKAIPEFSGHRVLITGGAGFMASHLVKRITEKNECVLFDTGFDGRPIDFTNLRGHKHVKCVTGDILDRDAVRAAADGCETVVHMAAVVGVQEVLKHPKRTIEVNFLGSRNTLDAITKPEKLHRFVYFSTSEVFGGMSFRVEERQSASVGNVNDARWSYSAAKLAGEHLAMAYHRESGLPAVIVRPFNVFGPLRTGDHAVLQFVLRALKDLPIEVHGDGSQIRSWCYVDDFIDGLYRCLAMPQAVGQDFNLGNPRNTCTILDLAQRITQILRSKSEIRFTHIDFSDIDLRVPRLTKARDLLGYEPTWDMQHSLEATAAWYKDHQDRVVLKDAGGRKAAP